MWKVPYPLFAELKGHRSLHTDILLNKMSNVYSWFCGHAEGCGCVSSNLKLDVIKFKSTWSLV